MAVTGVHHLYLETHNWGKTVAFWTELGFTLEDDFGGSGILRAPGGGRRRSVSAGGSRSSSTTSQSSPAPASTAARLFTMPPLTDGSCHHARDQRRLATRVASSMRLATPSLPRTLLTW